MRGSWLWKNGWVACTALTVAIAGVAVAAASDRAKPTKDQPSMAKKAPTQAVKTDRMAEKIAAMDAVGTPVAAKELRTDKIGIPKEMSQEIEGLLLANANPTDFLPGLEATYGVALGLNLKSPNLADELKALITLEPVKDRVSPPAGGGVAGSCASPNFATLDCSGSPDAALVGDTTGAGDDCSNHFNPADDHVWELTVTVAGEYRFLMDQNPPGADPCALDSYMYLDDTCCPVSPYLGSDDDCDTIGCFGVSCIGETTPIILAPGTYYLLVEGFDNTQAGPYEVTVLCTPAGVCGDGVLNTGEGCDDGNLVDNDGCSSLCVEEGACCIKGVGPSCSCQNLTSADCTTAGGLYRGDASLCGVGLEGDCDCNGNNICDQNDLLPGGGTNKDEDYILAPALAITDCSGGVDAPVSDTRTWGGTCGPIDDLNVDLIINHTWVGDLYVTLTHVNSGTTATLMRRVGLAESPGPLCSDATCCGNSTDNVDVLFDDEATDCVETGPFPLAGGASYKPSGGNPTGPGTTTCEAAGSLAVFDGLDKCSDWTLTVQDGGGGDTGTLVQWSLHFLNGALPPVGTDCNANDILDGCESPDPNTVGACCLFVGGCTLTTPAACTAPDVFQGLCTECSPGACPSVCGNSVVEPTEECDDGNLVDNDGCDSACQLEGACCKCAGSCSIDSETDCLAANGRYKGDASDCGSVTCDVCGDGTIGPDEECDDGNAVPGDGCDSCCQNEPPANDDCTGAIAVSVPGSGPVQSNADATDDIQDLCGTAAVNQGLWYTVLGNGNTITVTTDNANTNYDTKIQVWCDCPASLCVGGDDDSGTGTTSLVSFCSIPGHTYYVMVGGFSSSTGNHQLDATEDGIACTPTVTCAPAVCGNGIIEAGEECDDGNVNNGDGCDSLCQLEPATNDNCIDRINITDGATAYDNSTATTDGVAEATCAFAFGDDQIYNDLWYNYTATCTGILVIDTCAGGDFDTRLAIYAGWTCPPGAAPLACDDDDDTATNLCGGTLESVITLPVTLGDQLKIRVGEFDALTTSGPDVLTVACTTPVCGNGTVEIGEECDDGNLVPGDGCNATCETEGACCDGTTCSALSDTDCAAISGAVYDGDGTVCGTQCNFGSCCIGTQGQCQDVSAACCADLGGTFAPLGSCATANCPCDVTCSGTAEGEADCGLPSDTVNGGCNSTPFVTTAIACGQTYCGTGAFDGLSRDTDWYQITLAAETEVTWEVEAEFEPVLIILDTTAGTNCAAPTFIASAVGDQCSVTSITTCLAAGTYEFFVGPDFTNIEACGAEYRATLTCDTCPPPPPAPADDCPATSLGTLNAAGNTDGTLAGSTDNFAAPTGCGIPEPCGFYGNGNDVIYEFTAGVSGDWTFSLCNSSPDWDSSIQIREGGACPGTNCVAADDDSCLSCNSPYEATVTATLTSGTLYYVIVDSFSGGTANFNLAWSISAAPTGACCGAPPAPNCSCAVMTESACTSGGGIYKGDGTACGGNICDCNTNGVCDQFDLIPGGGFVQDTTPDLAIPDAGATTCPGTACAVGQVCVDTNGLGTANRCGVSDSLVVGPSASITDLDVGIDISHTFEADLIIILEKGATRVRLLTGDNINADGDDLDGLYVFNDEAGSDIHTPDTGLIAPGNYTGDEALSAFDGQDQAGTWTLYIADDVGADLGTLRGWTLFSPAGSAPATSADCNANGTPDECELTSNDCNGNSIPDDCELAGNDVIPPGGDGIPDDCNCVVDGDCGVGETCNPCTNVCEGPAGFPCVTAVDCRNDAVNNNACNCAQCIANVCVYNCVTFGNTNCAGPANPNLDDILCVLAGFGTFSSCPNGDIAPCGGNNLINLDDILAVLNAFGGNDPCGCQGVGGTPPLCGGP